MVQDSGKRRQREGDLIRFLEVLGPGAHMVAVCQPCVQALAAAGLVFSGVAERLPNVKWVLGHLGGAIPYLAERLDRGYDAYPQCRENISRRPSEYLTEQFYYDTVNFDPSAVRVASTCTGIVRAASFRPWRSTVRIGGSAASSARGAVTRSPASSPLRLVEV